MKYDCILWSPIVKYYFKKITMKKFIFIAALLVGCITFMVHAKETPPVGGAGGCAKAKSPEVDDGYCIEYFDENNVKTYKCVDPANQPPNCKK